MSTAAVPQALSVNNPSVNQSGDLQAHPLRVHQPHAHGDHLPQALSVHKLAYEEAIRHKWLKSEQNGYDVGDQAVEEWYNLNWVLYLRFRRLEHLLGHCHWSEFEPQSFGVFAASHQFDQTLLDRILDRLCAGQENLDVINWAFEWHLDIDEVIRILESFDVNGTRFDPETP